MEELAAYLPDEEKALLAQIAERMKKFFKGELNLKPLHHDGYVFIPGFQPETARVANENLDTFPNAVYVSSFPKTGTNWMMEIVRQILYGDDPKMAKMTKAIPLPLLALELGSPVKFQIIKHIPIPRRFFLTHLPTELLDVGKIKKNNGKVIYIMRNPKDQAVSWYHFAQSAVFNGARDLLCPEWDKFFSNYTQGKQPICMKEGEWYFDHILDWYNKYKNDKDFLFLQFEDVKKDPKEQIQAISEFLGVKLTEKRLDEIVQATSFSSMKKATEQAPSEKDKLMNQNNTMRKGQVGSWREQFTDAQSQLMDKIAEEKMAHTDIKFTYDL